MDYTEKKVKTLNEYKGVIVTVSLDKISQPDGRESYREVVSHPGGVCILALDGQNRAICVRQYRYCIGEHMLELPAGKLEYGEDPYECAVRELSEETGITAGSIVSLGSMYPSAGFCRETLHLYLAQDLHFGEAHLDEGEFLDVIPVPMEELVAQVMSGEMKDAKTIIAVLKAKLYLEGK